MKIFIHIISQGGKGADEAAENRNYLSGRMSDELNEIIRVLQLTTYDEEEWEADQLTVGCFLHHLSTTTANIITVCCDSNFLCNFIITRC